MSLTFRPQEILINQRKNYIRLKSFLRENAMNFLHNIMIICKMFADTNIEIT